MHMRVKTRRPRWEKGAELQAHGNLLDPNCGCSGRLSPYPRQEDSFSPPGEQHLLHDKVLCCGGDPGHGLHPHTPGRVWEPGEPLPGRGSMGGLPLCGLRLDGLSDRDDDDRHLRDGLLQAVSLHEEGERGRGDARRA